MSTAVFVLISRLFVEFEILIPSFESQNYIFLCKSCSMTDLGADTQARTNM